MKFWLTISAVAFVAYLLTGRAVDVELDRQLTAPVRVEDARAAEQVERVQGKPIRWWARRAVQARKDANKRQLTIFRQKRENTILRKKIEWQLERRVGNRSHWLCIHRGERGAAGWATNTGNGYFGGLQMDWSFMRTYGPELLRSKGTADRWTMEEQMMVAERARASGRGYYPWPNTARRCGLL